jgi:hypothetical protein
MKILCNQIMVTIHNFNYTKQQQQHWITNIKKVSVMVYELYINKVAQKYPQCQYLPSLAYAN